MVVGHTIQQSSEGFRVRTRCDGRVVLGDTAISHAYGGEPSFIEHDGEGGAIAVYPSLGLRQPLPVPPKPPRSSPMAEAIQLQQPSRPVVESVPLAASQLWLPAAPGHPRLWPLALCPCFVALTGAILWRRRRGVAALAKGT